MIVFEIDYSLSMFRIVSVSFVKGLIVFVNSLFVIVQYMFVF
jgi:hypothetical protein